MGLGQVGSGMTHGGGIEVMVLHAAAAAAADQTQRQENDLGECGGIGSVCCFILFIFDLVCVGLKWVEMGLGKCKGV